jgi:hypothetical protein
MSCQLCITLQRHSGSLKFNSVKDEDLILHKLVQDGVYLSESLMNRLEPNLQFQSKLFTDLQVFPNFQLNFICIFLFY